MHLTNIIPHTFYHFNKAGVLQRARHFVSYAMHCRVAILQLRAGNMQLVFAAMTIVLAAGALRLVAKYIITTRRKILLHTATGENIKMPSSKAFGCFIGFNTIGIAYQNISRPPPFVIA